MDLRLGPVFRFHSDQRSSFNCGFSSGSVPLCASNVGLRRPRYSIYLRRFVSFHLCRARPGHFTSITILVAEDDIDVSFEFKGFIDDSYKFSATSDSESDGRYSVASTLSSIVRKGGMWKLNFDEGCENSLPNDRERRCGCPTIPEFLSNFTTAHFVLCSPTRRFTAFPIYVFQFDLCT